MPQTDYHLAENWLCRPETIPCPADVFYLCPTGYLKTPNGPLICTVNNRGMRLRLKDHLAHSASAFMTAGNFFAPCYRQAAIECLLDLHAENLEAFVDGPVTDALNAFHHYIRYFNQGRPFILAGHSQGALLLQAILSHYFKAFPEVQKRMIAAYCIGFSITKSFMAKNPHLTFAKGRLDTGCLISFNTEAPGYTGSNITLLPDALVINPISWTRDETPALATQSLGAHLINRHPNGQIIATEDRPHYADARLNLNRGVVVCTTADPDQFKIIGLESFFNRSVLHAGDLSLYYYDLRQNAKDRVAAWFSAY